MFVTFEGPEGAGKSTAIRAVAERLRAQGSGVLLTREPGEGPVGQAIREILLHGEDLDRKTELLLFLADRAQHVESVIRPGLAAGRLVLCDRYSDSTVVYQAYARGLEPDSVRQMNSFATGGLTPDLTLLLDLPAEVGISRLTSKDRLDAEPLAFHQRVREGFLAESIIDPNRWTVINAAQAPEAVVEQCLEAIADGMRHLR